MTEPLSPSMAIVWVFVGIIISLVLPVAVRTLKGAKLEALEKLTVTQRIAEAWKRYGGNRYLAIALAATVVAVVLVLLLGLKFSTTRDAALAGFAWESLVNKLFSPQANAPG